MKKVMRSSVFPTLLGLITALAVSFTSFAAPAFLKAATYAGDTWVMNFWNSEMDHLSEDMAQIAADGFNTIILAVPWREFQPYDGTFNDYAFENLDRVMNAAGEHGLWVMFRASYRWDFYDGPSFTENFHKLMYDEETRAVWRSYMERIYRAGAAHENFYGGFICWEDFWDYLVELTSIENIEDNLTIASRLGYQDYLREHYTLDQINEAYGVTNITSYEGVYIPQSLDHRGMKLFYEFYDQRLLELLQIGQEVFPNLSMEVRLDVDPLDDGNGGLIGADHFKTFPCLNSSYTSLVFSVYMGQEQNTKISAQQALNGTMNMLQLVKDHNSGKPIFIDQLLYMDKTEAYADNTQIRDEEVASYLTQLAPVLKNYTMGYGVWAYRDYRNNALYNYQFAQGNKGWNFSNQANTTERNGSRVAHLKPYGSISQTIGESLEGKTTHDNIVAFTADSEGPVSLRIALGDTTRTVEVNGPQSFEVSFGSLDFDELTFTASSGDVYIDNVYLYNFVQDGQLYNYDNTELGCIGAIRSLNSQLD